MSKRSTLVVAVALLLAVTMGWPALAQEASPGATSGHTLVGSWLVDTAADDPANPPSSSIFHADGTYLQADVDGVAVGVWEPTGPQSAAATFIYHAIDDSGALSGATVRVALEVASDGQTFTASYTVDLTGPDGTASGQLGPGTATGTRMTVDPMGTPVGPLGPAASPGASPASSPAASPASSPAASAPASPAGVVVGAAGSNTAPCTLLYQRADNMWAAKGRPDGNLGTEQITLLPGQRKVFVTDWAYEKRRNDGSNYYGSHLRLARVPSGSGPTAFDVTNMVTQKLGPGEQGMGYGGFHEYKNDLKQVWCPA